MSVCVKCGTALIFMERLMYTNVCEDCEREWSDRLDAWRHGGKDEGLDRMYSPPPTIDQGSLQ